MKFGLFPGVSGLAAKPARGTAVFLTAAGLLFTINSALGIVVVGSGDPTYNTTAPTGNLANSGWQWEGGWGDVTATAIGPHHIVSASHVGGGAGAAFDYRGKRYLGVASYLAPGADLRVTMIAGTLPDYAPLYTDKNEPGKGLVLIGAGGPRGTAVSLTVGSGKKLKGWIWNGRDGHFRWGTNTVLGIAGTGDVASRAPLPADQIACTFDSSAGNDEATLTVGDSGGGAFLFDGGKWKLAGILRAVESTFRYSATDSDFSAAIFDKGGLYEYDGSSFKLVPALAVNRPTVFYAVRISGSASWISQVMAGTATPEYTMFVESSASPEGPFTADSSVVLDTPNARFVAPISDSLRYYRVADGRFNITGVKVNGDKLYLSLEL